MSEKNSMLSKRYVQIAIGLLGLDEMGYPRTQSEVARILGIQTNSMPHYVSKLIERGFIQESKRKGKSKWYCKGPNFDLLASQISDEITHQMVALRSCRNDQGGYLNNEKPGALCDIESDTVSEDIVKDSCPIALDVHQSGSWIQFRVEKAGELFEAPIDVYDGTTGEIKTYKQKLFDPKSEWEFDGGVNWTGWMVLDGTGSNRFQIRYQKTERKGYFYVHPEFDVLMTPEDIKDTYKVRTKFLVVCTPLLRWFEKHAGWVFMKDEFAKYVITSKVRVDELHKAIRGPVNDTLVKLSGGVFGRSDEGIWCDNSPGTPEVETTQEAYVEGIVKIPETRILADLAYKGVKGLGSKVDTLDARIIVLEQTADATIGILEKHQQEMDSEVIILTKLVNITTQLIDVNTKVLGTKVDAAANVLVEGQKTLFDTYDIKPQPPTEKKDDVTQTGPPEGYH